MEQKRLYKTIDALASKRFNTENDMLHEVLLQLVESSKTNINGGRIWKLNPTKHAYELLFQMGKVQKIKKDFELPLKENPILGVVAKYRTILSDETNETLLKKGMRLNPYHPSWFHLVPFFDHYRRGEYEKAFTEALKFNYPGLFWDPVMRAATLGQMGRAHEAEIAVDELLKLVPDFTDRGRRLISRYVKVDDLVDKIIEGLKKASLGDIG